jgi:nicotinamide mononucleotide transporter
MTLQPLEIVGTALGLANLWLTVRQNIWCWPIGIACVLCFGVVFFDARLYSDVFLQVVYLIVQIYGWWFWLNHKHSGTSSTAPIAQLTMFERVTCLIAIGIAALGLGFFMATFTKADLPYLDAVPTSLSIAAQCLQTRKIIDSWLLFIVANLLFIGIYATKGLYVTIALYIVSTALAIIGFKAWKLKI